MWLKTSDTKEQHHTQIAQDKGEATVEEQQQPVNFPTWTKESGGEQARKGSRFDWTGRTSDLKGGVQDQLLVGGLEV